MILSDNDFVKLSKVRNIEEEERMTINQATLKT